MTKQRLRGRYCGGLWGLLGGLWLVLCVGVAWAKPVKAPHIEVELVSEVTAVQPGVPFWVGVRQKLDPHWHTYWRNAGDSGLAPKMKWEGHKGLSISSLQWPTPSRIRVKHLVNYGYENEVLLLFRVTPAKELTGKALTLRGRFSWLVCKVECIPGKASLSVTLPVVASKAGPAAQQAAGWSRWRGMFRRFRARLPGPLPGAQVRWSTHGERVYLRLKSEKTGFIGMRTDFFPEDPSVIENATVQRHLWADGWLLIAMQKSTYFEERKHFTGLLRVQALPASRPASGATSAPSSRAVGKGTPGSKGHVSSWQTFRIVASPAKAVAGAMWAKQLARAAGRVRLSAVPPKKRAGTKTTTAGGQKSKTKAGPKAADAGGTAVSGTKGSDAKKPAGRAVSGVRLDDLLRGVGKGAGGEDYGSLWTVLLLAFLGGLLLNLMPCVFPILTIKILNFVEQANEAPRVLRLHGVAFLVGVLASFGLLAGVLLALRAGGEQLGWGFQLQSPSIVFALACILFAMGLSLSGVFELGNSWMNVGDSLTNKAGYTGSFFTGVLATVVATPCTAPFMGSAIAYALVQPAWIGMLIFEALGFGMALPYVLLSFFPRGLKLLPRPGRWMEIFKEVMAFPLYATAIWLLWVLGQQAGSAGVVTALKSLLVLALAAWLFRVTRLSRVALLGGVLALALVVVAGVVGVRDLRGDVQSRRAAAAQTTAAHASKTDKHRKGVWREKYSKKRLLSLLARDKTVFLNMTAAWCITCKVNERIALETNAVKQAFDKHEVYYLLGDWTNGDKEITALLERFRRNGVPLYVFFKGKSGRTKILPQLLTKQIVLQALRSL